MELENYDEKSCGLVLFRENNGQRQYLLLHYPNGHWDFPKGHVEEEDQDEHQTAQRELLEETGIKNLEFIPDYREIISYSYLRHDTRALSKKIVVFFLGKTTDQNSINLSHEHHDSQWLNYQEALEQITFDNAKNILRKAEEFLLSSS